MGQHYQHTFSVVLMAIVDAKYKFRCVSVGALGRISDAGVFNNCSVTKALYLVIQVVMSSLTRNLYLIVI